MPSIFLSRHAIQELRQLRSATNNRIIPEILQALADGSSCGLQILLGYHNIKYRKRRLEGGGYLRLFMDDHYPSHYTVISAVLRDDDTYEQNFDTLPREPRYLWEGEIGLNWDWFINEGYLYSAQINDQQRQDAHDAVNGDRQPYYHHHPDALHVPYQSTIHQSAPGTGKTLTAAEKACELAEAGHNVVFLLPEALIDQQVSKYRCVRQIRQQPAGQNLFIGTFHQWLTHQFPALPYRVASPAMELQHLQKLAYGRRDWLHSNRAPITYRDVLLYQLYILNSHSGDRRRDDIYNDNRSRIEELKQIPTRWWHETWTSSVLYRLKYALTVTDYFQEFPPNPPVPGLNTTIIVDEAQDYLIEEIELIKYLCGHWQSEPWQSDSQHQVNLWLLGDINQRIAPVNFDWGGLHLNKLQELEWKNYRTTATILTLANRFQVKANQAQGCDTRWLPEPTNPEQCFERPGDAVRLLVYPDLASAETFLDPLVESISEQISGWQEKHSLQWRLAARARLFCSDTYHVNQNRVKFLEFMPVSQAKGREFESCIAFCIFDLSTQYGQMESYTKWYTQLTRARRRLLIVTTQDQLNAVGQDIFCPKTDGDENINIVQWLDYRNPQEVKDALDWIIEFRSGLDGSETGRKGLIDIVIDGILQASPILYYDIYDVLNRYDISGQNLIDLEIEIVNYLFAKSEVQDCLKDYLNRPEVQDIPRLLTLIHRCLGQSWQAATIAQSLRETAPQTYGEIITGICQDLQHRGLPFEAKRLVNLYSLDSAIENHSNTIFSNHNGKLLLTLSNWVEQQLTLH